jgi:tetratricopeptide (TPR) repeat protein
MFAPEDPLLEMESARLFSRIDLDERPKEPLLRVASSLLLQLGELVSQTNSAALDASSWNQAIQLYNRGALVEYLACNYERSKLLCHCGISLCRQYVASVPFENWIGKMTQLYINLARLEATKGNLKASLSFLEQLRGFVDSHQNLEIDGFCIHGELAASLGACGSVALVLRNVYLCDSIRAYFIAGEYEGLREFLARVDQEAHYQSGQHRYILLEARLRMLIKLQDYKEAGSVLSQWLDQLRANPPWHHLIPLVYILLSNLYCYAGKLQEGQKVLDKVVQHIPHLAPEDSRDLAAKLRIAQTTYLCALGQFLAGNRKQAAFYAKEAIAAGHLLSDELLVMKGLMLLVKVGAEYSSDEGTHENLPESQEELRCLADGSMYQFERAVAYWTLASLDSNANLRQRQDHAAAAALLVSINSYKARELRNRVCPGWEALGSGRTNAPEENNDDSGNPVRQLTRSLLDYHEAVIKD